MPLGRPLGLALLSGTLLAVACNVSSAAPMQLVAFIPWLLALRRSPHASSAAVAGVVFALVRFVPLARALGDLPPAAWFGIPAYILVMHASFGALCFLIRSLPAQAFLVAAAFAAMELLDAHLPMWGTALSLASAWSSYPDAIRFIEVTGTPGVAFVVVLVQLLAVACVGAPRGKRRALALVLGGIVGAVAAFAVLHEDPPPPALRVAAIGWPRTWPNSPGPKAIDSLVGEAASRGARLVVLPEAAFVGSRDLLLSSLKDLAQRHDVFLAVGYIDYGINENRLVFVDPKGAILGEYVKTHLVPLAESTHAGDGRPVVVDIDGVKVGGVICQDDNFPDLAARYGRAGARLLVSPTSEMSPTLGTLHMKNARLRPIESGFFYLRAVAGGTSAVLSPNGAVLEARDHLTTGPGSIVVDLR